MRATRAARAPFFAALPIALLATYACTYDYAAASHCNDGVKDADETGVDCGGSCGPCARAGGGGPGGGGGGGSGAGGCGGNACGGSCGSCALHCSNGKQDADETDEDCGGSCPPCDLGLHCKTPADCNDARCLDGACAPLTYRWTSLQVTNPPDPRYAPALAYRSTDHTIVMFGGHTPGGEVNETWVLAGSAWELKDNLAHNPSARSDAALGYHPALGVVMVGGLVSYPGFDDSWFFDGTDWTRAPDMLPAKRFGAAAAYDDVDDLFLVFDGDSATPPLLALDVGTQTWSKVTPVAGPAPTARYDHAMVYDPNRGFVAFGGNLSSGGNSNETWVFKPVSKAWSLLATPPDALTPRYGMAMGYDSDRGVIVIYGGRGAQIYDETWELAKNGVWQNQQQSLGTQPKRFSTAMVYDTYRKRMLLFGGAESSFAAVGGTFIYAGYGGPCDVPSCSGRCIDHVCCDESLMDCPSGYACNTHTNPGICTKKDADAGVDGG